MEDLSHDQFIAIEQFVKDLRVCYENYKKLNSIIPFGGELVNITMDYAIQTLDSHRDLAGLKCEKWSNQMAEALDKGVK